ncbi:hypothetical protein CVT24_000597 [Panaeolus cyanescens]|uniref:Uncharacterized protein n=1 Tax=Panaeolus cyanescens TaxID=181874 RepID=A0A409YDI8_9AGAR|nr:hypothetical protein CVT24_000597 [Panaeolus cyanescens]
MMSTTGFTSGGFYWNHLLVVAMDYLEAAFDDLLVPAFATRWFNDFNILSKLEYQQLETNLNMPIMSKREKTPDSASLRSKSSRRTFLATISRFYGAKTVVPAPVKNLETPASSTLLVKAEAQDTGSSSQEDSASVGQVAMQVETTFAVDEADSLKRHAALLDGLSTAVTVLQNLSSIIPFPPAAALISATLKIISVFKDSANVRIECLDLSNRIATYVLLVMGEVQDQGSLSPQLISDLDSFKRALAGLYEQLFKGIPPEQNAMIAAINARVHQGVLRSCEVELQRQIERFQVLRSIHDGKLLFKTLVQTKEIFKLSSEANQTLRKIDYKLEMGLKELRGLLQKGRVQQGSAEILPTVTQLIGCGPFITQVVNDLTSGANGSVCILGAEGTGKTSIAVQIMDDHRIRSKFPDDSYELEVGSARRIEGLRRALSVIPGRKLILLDDFENVWDAQSGNAECKAALETLTDNTNAMILMTMKPNPLPTQETSQVPLSPCKTHDIPPLDSKSAKELFGSYYALKNTQEESKSLDIILEKLDGRPSLIKLVAIRAVNSTIADIENLVLEMGASESGHPTSFIVKDSLSRLQNVPNAQKILNTLALFPSGLQEQQLGTWLSFRNGEALGYLRGIGVVFYNSGNHRWFLSPLIRSYLPSTDEIATSARNDAHSRMLAILQQHKGIWYGPEVDSFKHEMEELSKHEPNLTEIVVDMIDMLEEESSTKDATERRRKRGREDSGKKKTEKASADASKNDQLQTTILESLYIFCVYQRWSRANREVAEAAVRLAERWKSPVMLAKLQHLLGAIYIQLDQYQDGYIQFSRATKNFESQKHRRGMVRSSTQSIKAQLSLYQGGINDKLLRLADTLAKSVELPTTFTLEDAKTKYSSADHLNDQPLLDDLDLELMGTMGSDLDQASLHQAEMMAQIQLTKAYLYRSGNKGAECLDRAEVALYLAKDVIKNKALTVECQYVRARGLALSGKYLNAIHELEQVIAFYEERGIQGKALGPGAYVYNALTRALKGAGKHGPALTQAAQRAVTMCQTYGSPWAAGEALLEYGELFIEEEKWDEAILIYGEALKEFERVDGVSLLDEIEACKKNLSYARVKAELPNIEFVPPQRA